MGLWYFEKLVTEQSILVILVEDREWRQGVRAEFFPCFDYVIFPFPPIVAVGCKRGPRQEKVAIDNEVTWAGIDQMFYNSWTGNRPLRVLRPPV